MNHLPQLLSTGLASLDHLLGGGLRQGALTLVATRPVMRAPELTRHFLAQADQQTSPSDEALPFVYINLHYHQEVVSRKVQDVFGERISRGKIFAVDEDDWHVPPFEALIWKLYAFAHGGLRLVVFDYAQAKPWGDPTDEEVGYRLAALRKAAQHLNAAVVVLYALPEKADQLGESGVRPALSQDLIPAEVVELSDTILFLYRPEFYGLDLANSQFSSGMVEVLAGKSSSASDGQTCLLRFQRAGGFTGL